MTEGARIVRALYSWTLKREPQPDELSYWTEQCGDIAAVPAVIDHFFQSEEYRKALGVVPGHPPGHFYSPIPDPSSISERRLEAARSGTADVAGVDLRLPVQRSSWDQLCRVPIHLARNKVAGRRYFFENSVYASGDAMILSGFLNRMRPRRVIEIGSGFSSACMLDAAEDHGLHTEFTFVEPHPETLFWHMTSRDRNACTVIRSPVQEVELSVFDALQPGDLLFIDSTHVMKSGSDVNFEIFEILPRLKAGVTVHFHDVFWPFEYPAEWLIDRRYAWNELYGLRAFLMYNQRCRIIFFNDAFNLLCSDAVACSPDPARELFGSNPGGGLWLLTH